jgi:hypothetical protein
VQTLVVLIEFSASVFVVKAEFPTTVVVVVVGFSDTTEQCFVFASCTTQYWSAMATLENAHSTNPQTNSFFILASPWFLLAVGASLTSSAERSSFCWQGTRTRCGAASPDRRASQRYGALREDAVRDIRCVTNRTLAPGAPSPAPLNPMEP